tara:strand:+ start:672 stop:1676 length:1005 start_codon:yes stop_codon:yes gene_type:complete
MNINSDYSTSRVFSRINHYIDKLGLNLEGFNVLTEVGSGLYNYTPIIPILAGANSVMAWTRDSSFGKADDIIAECRIKLDKMGYEDSIEFFKGSINKNHLKNANIITNSGFLRPLNKEKLKHVKQTTVIPLMYELWELRQGDIDIDYCTARGLKVAGTNEYYKDISVFEHVGYLALKMAFEAGYEILNNKIIIWSDDKFGEEVENTFNCLNPLKIIKTTDFEVLKKNIQDVDFIFICDYDEMREYLTPDFFGLDELVKINSHFAIIHLYGKIDKKNFDKITIYPPKSGLSKTMSFTLAHLGLNPFVALQVAGFKVGEMMAKQNLKSNLMQPINF